MPTPILVVDDSTTIQKVIKIAFAPYDVSVDTAASLDEALQKLGEQSYFLVLADATLPGTTECQDFQPLQDMATDKPVIILSGTYDGIDATEFHAKGFPHIVKKPFESNELIEKIEAILGAKLQLSIPKQDELNDAPEIATDFSLEEDEPFQPEQSLDNVENHVSSAPTISPEPDIPPAPPQKAANKAASTPVHLSPEMTSIIRQSVNEYCLQHFGPLAKEIIQAEIKKLVEEKARQFIDK